MWQLFSHLPPNHTGNISDDQRAMGSGMAVDKAWQLHTGTPETLIAVLDSGIHWDAQDLIERHFLNRAELPLPADSMQYDKNGDGRFSVSDYAGDQRVSDLNRNGVIDAGDLIRAFSDGTDADGNGYVDDIAGWDFHENDNDPSDRTKFGHGTGEAKDSAAAINNGVGGAGICGNCSFMALRVDDSFVIDVNAFSRAVIYATDRGASLIQQALGSANANPFVKYAANYAYDRNVVIIGSAADENSYHHNWPSTYDPIVYTNAIRHDANSVNDSTTFLNFNNCSNYGARVDVATSGRSCSSEATGNLSGISALTWSYARSLGIQLTAGELISLIKTHATDINLGPNDDDPSRHSTFAGWDSITGYGRTNAHAMLDAVRQGKIPPEARITTPEWFEHVDASAPSMTIGVQVGVPRSGRAKLRLDVTRGVETTNAAWLTLREATYDNQAVHDDFFTVTTQQLLELPVRDGEPSQYREGFTFRLVVDDLNGLSAEARRTVFVSQDPARLAGFPRTMNGSGESAGLFIDLNRDGADEFVVGDGAGYVHAFTADGSELSGFPVPIGLSHHSRPDRDELVYSSIYGAVAADDLDRDGVPEIVAATMEGHIAVLDARGRFLPGFPRLLPRLDWNTVSQDQVLSQGVWSTPVIADVNADGRADVIVASLDGHVYAMHATGESAGRDLIGFPVAVDVGGKRAKLLSSPAAYDLDGDGFPELIFGTNHAGTDAGQLWAVSGRGQRATSVVLPGFPTRVPLLRDVVLPTVGTGIPTSPVVADFDGDGEVEILVHGFVGKTYLFTAQGGLKQSLSIEVDPASPSREDYMLGAFGHPAVGDVTGDGRLSPTIVGVGQGMLVSLALGGKKYDFDHLVGAFDVTTGRLHAGFPQVARDMQLNVAPLVLDLDGDGAGEMIAGSGGYELGAWNGRGPVAGFPRFTGGWVFGAASAGDADGDGLLEVAVTTREGKLFMWKTDAPRAAATRRGSWPTFKGNAQRTGVAR